MGVAPEVLEEDSAGLAGVLAAEGEREEDGERVRKFPLRHAQFPQRGNFRSRSSSLILRILCPLVVTKARFGKHSELLVKNLKHKE